MMLGDKPFIRECNNLEQCLGETTTPLEVLNILNEFKQGLKDFYRIVSPTNMLYRTTKLNSYLSSYSIIYNTDLKEE